jgi:hypothetical protein
MNMQKTQVYLPPGELKALHRLARKKRRRVGDLVREAIRKTWLAPTSRGPVGLWDGPIRGSARDHDAAFDDQ